jgi:hypothetical protein
VAVASPLATCLREDCLACPIREVIHCHFRVVDFVRFMAIALPSLLVGAVGIEVHLGYWLVPWAILSAAFFGFIEIRVLCSHCPHYAQPGRVLRCWANPGSPKVWKYHPGPLARVEKVVFLSGLAAIWGFPLACTILGGDWLLAALLGASTGAFFVLLRRRFCSRCMNFACPLNLVRQPTREQFFRLNPACEWGKKEPLAD